MLGGIGLLELLIILLVFAIPFFLLFMLARMKGKHWAWSLFFLIPAIGFIVVGALKTEPEKKSAKTKWCSIASIVVGSLWLLLKLVGVLLAPYPA